MKFQITITFRNGEAIQSLTYTTEVEAALCKKIKLPSHPRLSGVAWSHVISVIVTPISIEA